MAIPLFPHRPRCRASLSLPTLPLLLSSLLLLLSPSPPTTSAQPCATSTYGPYTVDSAHNLAPPMSLLFNDASGDYVDVPTDVRLTPGGGLLRFYDPTDSTTDQWCWNGGNCNGPQGSALTLAQVGSPGGGWPGQTGSYPIQSVGFRIAAADANTSTSLTDYAPVFNSSTLDRSLELPAAFPGAQRLWLADLDWNAADDSGSVHIMVDFTPAACAPPPSPSSTGGASAPTQCQPVTSTVTVYGMNGTSAYGAVDVPTGLFVTPNAIVSYTSGSGTGSWCDYPGQCSNAAGLVGIDIGDSAHSAMALAFRYGSASQDPARSIADFVDVFPNVSPPVSPQTSTFIAPATLPTPTSQIWLSCLDDEPGDNSGSVNVTITVTSVGCAFSSSSSSSAAPVLPPQLLSVSPTSALDVNLTLLTLSTSNVPAASDGTVQCSISVTNAAAAGLSTPTLLTTAATYVSPSLMQCTAPAISGLRTNDTVPAVATVQLIVSGSPIAGVATFTYYGTCASLSRCSGHGVCVLGACSCFSHYVSSDCSVAAFPPVLSFVDSSVVSPVVSTSAQLFAGTPFALPVYQLSGSSLLIYSSSASTAVTGLSVVADASTGVLTLSWTSPDLTTPTVILTVTATNVAGSASATVLCTVISPLDVSVHVSSIRVMGLYVVGSGASVGLSGSAAVLPAAVSLPNITAVDQSVPIHVTHNGYVRTLTAVTNTVGAFTAVFSAYPGDSGLYTVTVNSPTAAPQDLFHVLILDTNPSSAVVNVVTGTTQTTVITTVTNPSDVAYHSLTFTAPGLDFAVQQGIVIGYSLQLSNGTALLSSSTLPAGASLLVQLTLASATSSTYFAEDLTLTFHTAETVTATLPLTLRFQPPHAALSLTPSTSTMVTSLNSITTLTAEVRNGGSSSTGVLFIQCPASAPGVPTLSLSSSSSSTNASTTPVLTQAIVSALQQLGLIPAGLTLAANPSALASIANPFLLSSLPADPSVTDTLIFSVLVDADVEVTSTYALTCVLVDVTAGQGSPLASLAVTVEVHSGAYANVTFAVVDELTYFNASAPGVSGAVITLTQGGLTYTGYGDGNGTIRFYQLPLGGYSASVQAAQHLTLGYTLVVTSGMPTQSVFLKYEAVSYTFSVTPSIFPDVISVSIDAVYSTSVPTPIVVLSPNTFAWADLEQRVVTSIPFTLTNLGLIEALNVQISLSHPYLQFAFPPNSNPIAVLLPNTTVQLPMTVIYPTTSATSTALTSSTGVGRRLLQSTACGCVALGVYYEPCATTPSQSVGIYPLVTGSACACIGLSGTFYGYGGGGGGSSAVAAISGGLIVQQSCAGPSKCSDLTCLACEALGLSSGVSGCQCTAASCAVTNLLLIGLPYLRSTTSVFEALSDLRKVGEGLAEFVGGLFTNSPTSDLQQSGLSLSKVLTVVGLGLGVLGVALAAVDIGIAAPILAALSVAVAEWGCLADYNECAEKAGGGGGGEGRRRLLQSTTLTYDTLDTAFLADTAANFAYVQTLLVDPTTRAGLSAMQGAITPVLSVLFLITAICGSLLVPFDVDLIGSGLADAVTTYTAPTSDGGDLITVFEYGQLFSPAFTAAFLTNYTTGNLADVQHLVQRLNRTAALWEAGVYTLPAAEAYLNLTAPSPDGAALQNAGAYSVSPPAPYSALDFVYLDQLTRLSAQVQADTAASAAQGFPDYATQLSDAVNEYSEASATEQQGICALVAVQLTKQTISAGVEDFIATLQLDNQLSPPLTSVFVQLVVTLGNSSQAGALAVAGQTSNDLFVIQPPTLTDIVSGDPTLGTAVIAGGSTGTLQWVILPLHTAALTPASVVYQVAGQVLYTQSGVNYTVPLLPATITVYPSPTLQLDYFLPTVVYGDDPFTPALEPQIPFVVGLLLTNSGPGTLLSLSLQSSAPVIVDNVKQLLVAFALVSTTVDGVAQLQRSLLDAVSVGALAVDGVVDYSDGFTVSLMGTFIAYNVTLTETLASLDQRLTSVSTLATHLLVQKVYVPSIQSTAYLAQDLPAPAQPATDPFSIPIPDTIHLPAVNPSTGGPVNASVSALYNVSCVWDDSLFAATSVLLLTVPASPSAYAYYRCAQPPFPPAYTVDPVLHLPVGSALSYAQVLGTSGPKLPASTAEVGVSNVWMTSRVVRPVSGASFNEFYFHLFDPQQPPQSESTITYQVVLTAPVAPLTPSTGVPSSSVASSSTAGPAVLSSTAVQRSSSALPSPTSAPAIAALSSSPFPLVSSAPSSSVTQSLPLSISSSPPSPSPSSTASHAVSSSPSPSTTPSTTSPSLSSTPQSSSAAVTAPATSSAAAPSSSASAGVTPAAGTSSPASASDASCASAPATYATFFANGLPTPLFWLSASSLPPSTTSVTSWPDLTLHLRNGTSSSPPAYVPAAYHGLPAVRFSGSADVQAASVHPTQSDWTVVLVLALSQPQAAGSSAYVFASKATADHSLLLGESPTTIIWYSPSSYGVPSGGPAVAGALPVPLGVPFVLSASYDFATQLLRMFINGQPAAEIGYTGATDSSISLGSGYWSGDSFVGDMMEALLFDVGLDDTPRAYLEQTLLHLYSGTPACATAAPSGALSSGGAGTGVSGGLSAASIYQALLTNGTLTPLFWLSASSIPSTTRVVDTWLDLTPAARTAISRSPPTHIAQAYAGLPAVRFSGSQDVQTAIVQPASADWSVVLVVAFTHPATSGYLLASRATNSRSIQLAVVDGQTYLFSWAPSGGRLSSMPLPAVGVPYVVSVTFSATERLISMYVDGQLMGTVVNTGNSDDTLELGNGYYPNNQYAGDMMEVIVFDHLLSDATRANLEQQLQALYHI